VSLYAPDGSLRVALDTEGDSNEDYSGGVGIYSKSGGYRINTTDTTPGRYAEDGALRGSVSSDEENPPEGEGLYTPDGALRLTVTGSDLFGSYGVYAADGSFRATVTNVDEEEE
jgi:hypothetical protein